VLRRLVLPLLLVLVVPWMTHAQQWSTYQPVGAGFSIDLPGDPTMESETSESAAGPVETHSASVEVGQAGYVSMYTIYPESTGMEADEALDAARDGMLEDGKSELREEKRLTTAATRFTSRSMPRRPTRRTPTPAGASSRRSG